MRWWYLVWYHPLDSHSNSGNDNDLHFDTLQNEINNLRILKLNCFTPGITSQHKQFFETIQLTNIKFNLNNESNPVIGQNNIDCIVDKRGSNRKFGVLLYNISNFPNMITHVKQYGSYTMPYYCVKYFWQIRTVVSIGLGRCHWTKRLWLYAIIKIWLIFSWKYQWRVLWT